MTPLQAIYLEWVNDFLTPACFARYHMIPGKDAIALIKICRDHHNDLLEASKPEPMHGSHNNAGFEAYLPEEE